MEVEEEENGCWHRSSYSRARVRPWNILRFSYSSRDTRALCHFRSGDADTLLRGRSTDDAADANNRYADGDDVDGDNAGTDDDDDDDDDDDNDDDGLIYACGGLWTAA